MITYSDPPKMSPYLSKRVNYYKFADNKLTPIEMKDIKMWDIFFQKDKNGTIRCYAAKSDPFLADDGTFHIEVIVLAIKEYKKTVTFLNNYIDRN